MKSYIETTIEPKISLRKLSKRDTILAYLSKYEDSSLSQKEQLTLLDNIK